ncbi:MAG: flagellar basal body-associated FliL family protein [Comamonadaceae bacterium]|nr:flagellar basal body-associated FliL family protein [Comamonadaceae bacterium]
MPEVTAATAPIPAPSRKKKWLIIVGALVLAVALAAAGTLWWIARQRSLSLDDDGIEQTSVAPRTPPAFLPMENLVVNLADTGGDRYAQVGITLELADAKVAETVKAYMPHIRSSVLLLLSQRTTSELLSREGKDRLARDVREEVLGALGQPSRAGASADQSPVHAVLFSSFIVQ